MPPVLIDARELAEELDASYGDVLDWARRGLIPSIKVGKHVYFHLGKVCKALRRRESAPEMEAATSCS